MDGKHVVISCTLPDKIISVGTFTFVNFDTTGFAFIDMNFASKHFLVLAPLKTPRHIEVMDGRLINSGAVSHVPRLGLYINGNEEVARFLTRVEVITLSASTSPRCNCMVCPFTSLLIP